MWASLGAVLSQKQSNGQLHPVAYVSRALSPPERNYGVTELEILTVVWAMQHFNAYIYGHKVTIVTDHSAAKSVLQTPCLNGKHVRWWLKVFGSGVIRRLTLCTDLDERIPKPTCFRAPDVQVFQVHATHAVDVDISQLLRMPPQTTVSWGFSQRAMKDPKLLKIMDFLNEGLLPNDSQEAKRLQLRRLSLL